MPFNVLNYDCGNFLFGKRFYHTFNCLALLLGFRNRIGENSLSYENSYHSIPTFRDLKIYPLYYNLTHLVCQHARNSGILSVFGLLDLVTDGTIDRDNYRKCNSAFTHFKMTKKKYLTFWSMVPGMLLKYHINF